MSERLQEQKKQLYNNMLFVIQNYINLLSEERNIINRISIVIELYKYVVDVIIKNKNLSSSDNDYLSFFKIMIRKKPQIEEEIKIQIKIYPDKKTIKKLYGEFMKIYQTFEKETMEIIFMNFHHHPNTTTKNIDCCPICLDTISPRKNIQMITNCNHCFHKQCLFQHIVNQKIVVCPLCRKKILFF